MTLRELFDVLWKNEWMPWSILNTITDKKFIDCSFLARGYSGYWLYTRGRTKIGECIDGLPGLPGALCTGLIYVIFGILWVCIVPLTGLIKMILTLLTSDWKEIRKKW